MTRTFIVKVEDSLRDAKQDIDELERKWGAEEIERKCNTCKHYTKGEFDGSCESYICREYSEWEDKT